MKKILAVMAVIFILCSAGAALAADPIKVGYLAALTSAALSNLSFMIQRHATKTQSTLSAV